MKPQKISYLHSSLGNYFKKAEAKSRRHQNPTEGNGSQEQGDQMSL
jgi:hypothetical protein